MARLSIFSERVRHLVDSKLVPFFLSEGSTAQLCKLLNNALSEVGNDRIIHPNRIHALLSDDIARGMNDATLYLIEQAVSACNLSDGNLRTRSDERIAQLRAQADQLRQARGLDDELIVKRLGIPSAVARLVLGFPTSVTTRAMTPSFSASPTPAPKTPAQQPDWSFQDIAIADTLDALRQRPASKVGLILPTGAGKTRTALRIILAILNQSERTDSIVYWVTHRKNLKAQSHRELQKLLTTARDQIPEDSATLLAKRIRFAMVGELPTIFSPDSEPPLLIVVDEAHHAAAPSYQPIFEASNPVPALFLTATPNRADRLPIGIDEISYTITHRELEERGVVSVPIFEDFPVHDFEWSSQQVKDLANYVIEETYSRFTKVLVLAPRIDRVTEFCDAVLDALSFEGGHPLAPDDIGYIHGSGNSRNCDSDEFLEHFAGKPRAILISAQLLLEGFDDPAINTVVLTYPSSSIVRLMQAAGRCVRYSPEKEGSYVVQARNNDLAYHFDQRWLYQEISDFLRPELLDIDYSTETDLHRKVDEMLAHHRVKPAERRQIIDQLGLVRPGSTCRLLLHGFPYAGDVRDFDTQAQWGAWLETEKNSTAFRGIFNAFCALGANLSDPSDFLAREAANYGIPKDLWQFSDWRKLMRVLTSSYLAYEEIYGSNPNANACRPSKRAGPTTWLKYVTLGFRPTIPVELSEFISDCFNKETVEAEYLEPSNDFALAIKLPLPLSGYEAILLDQCSAANFEACVSVLRDRLSRVSPAERIGELAAFTATAHYAHLPSRILLRIQPYLSSISHRELVLRLSPFTRKETHHD